MLVKLLTDNKSFIRKNIVSRYVPFVNNKILEYAMSIGLTHHTVKIESDLSSTIEYMGESVSYFNMSAGERLRLQTAVAFAFRDLMSMMGREFNMMFVDELIDSGGDASMTELTLEFIQEKTNALMISHKQEALEYIPHTDRIMIHKVNGFSRIVE
jgi:Fe-S cluster assembly ATPase SufC